MSPLTRWSAAAAAAGGLVRAAPDLEKVIVIHDPVRYSVAGAWTVAIVPFRFVTSPHDRVPALRYRKACVGQTGPAQYSADPGPHAARPFFSPLAFPAADSSAGRAQMDKGADLGAHGPWPSSNLDSTAPCTCPVGNHGSFS